MDIFIIVLLLVIFWVSLYSKIGGHSSKIDTLTREIARLKDLIEQGNRLQKEVTPPDKKKSVKTAKSTVENLEAIIDTPADGIPKENREYTIPQMKPDLSVSSVEKSPEKQIEEETARPPEKKLPPKPFPPKPQKEKAPLNYEEFIGGNLFGKIGILVLVIGMGFFVKYAIDNQWINETFRTILGFTVGIILQFIAWRLKEKYRAFSSLLAGGSFAIFYVTVAMAYHYYGLFSQTTAFVLLIIFTILMSLLSLFYNRRELAIIALGGGFIAPFLVSSGEGNYIVLFTYVIILNIGMFVLSIYKKWGELPILCFILTWLVLLGYSVGYDIQLMKHDQLVHLLSFAMAFYLIFLLSIVSVIQANGKTINQILFGIVTLNNFVFLFFALWFLHIMNLPTNNKGIFTLFVALINLVLFFWIRTKGVKHQLLVHTLLGIAITFISITIPIQLEGTFITLFWAAEMVVIMWLYTKFRIVLYKVFSILLPILTFISYILDLNNALEYWNLTDKIFLNGVFATGLFTTIAFGVYAWLQQYTQSKNTWTILIACFVFYCAFIVDFHLYIKPALVSYSYMQVFTAFMLCALSGIFAYKRFPISIYKTKYITLLAISLLLFWALSYSINHAYTVKTVCIIIQWISLFILTTHLILIGKYYYKQFDIQDKGSNAVTLSLSVLSIILLLIGTNNLLYQLSLTDEANAGFSITLGIAGFIWMTIGMRKHLKIMRMISLCTFGIVLLKLVFIDLWLLPTFGKVVVFVLLGVLLLILSFLYQKLKTALFTDNKEMTVLNETIPEDLNKNREETEEVL